MTRNTARWELVDWTPAKHPPILLAEHLTMRRRRTAAWMCNMHLRKVGTRYLHKGRKP
jgi:hypothetical protein